MKRITAALLLAFFATVTVADDWPQWQGPGRDNKSAEKGLLKKWPEGGPKLAWTFNSAGAGYSSPSIVGDRLYMTGARDKVTELYAIDVTNGKEVWKAKIGPAFDFKGNQWGIGPRSAPTVHNGMVYALGGGGELICADAKTGDIVWKKNLPGVMGGQVNPIGGGPKNIGWGYCWSPLVDNNALICLPGGPGGLFAALDLKNGKEIWRSNGITEQATYSSPIVAEVDGVRQYIAMTQEGVAGVAAKDGALLWYHKRSRPYPDVVITTPIYHDGHVYVTAGYGAGCELIKLTKNGNKFDTKLVYSNKYMKNTLGGVVLLDGYVYGASERRGWICQDFKTGKIKWSKKNVLGDGSLIYADGHLYCYDERNGVVALVDATPKGWKETGRFTIPKTGKMKGPSSQHWTHPVIANGKLYIRDQELLFCYEVK